jgi:hypothetical protein
LPQDDRLSGKETVLAWSEGSAAVIAERSRENVDFNFAFNDNKLDGISPTLHEILYLRRGLVQAGGKLPLFDLDGQAVDPGLVRHCLAEGWAEPWFSNPLKPEWLVCKLTGQGRQIAEAL